MVQFSPGRALSFDHGLTCPMEGAAGNAFGGLEHSMTTANSDTHKILKAVGAMGVCLGLVGQDMWVCVSDG